MFTLRDSWVAADLQLPGTAFQPVGFAAGDQNLYRYVGNNPTNATDPSGLETLSYSTVSYPRVGPWGLLEPGWTTIWHLDGKNTDGGWIVQHVRKQLTIRVPGAAPGKFEAGFDFQTEYWEAWWVPPGRTFTDEGSKAGWDDLVSLPKPGNISYEKTIGRYSFRGEAAFYAGDVLPKAVDPKTGQFNFGGFEQNNIRVPDAGKLFSTHLPPKLGKPTTSVVTKFLVASWEPPLGRTTVVLSTGTGVARVGPAILKDLSGTIKVLQSP